jgi:hypothetical protein
VQQFDCDRLRFLLRKVMGRTHLGRLRLENMCCEENERKCERPTHWSKDGIHGQTVLGG